MKKFIVKYEMTFESEVDMTEIEDLDEAIKNGDIKVTIDDVNMIVDDVNENVDEVTRARLLKDLMAGL